jgi:ABC-type spermidine/putrescine transport system permease subunit I
VNAARRQQTARIAVTALLLAPAMAIIALGFVAPLMRLAALSFSAPAGPLAAYRELATVDVYRVVLRNTAVLALVVSAASLAIGFALAFMLIRLEAAWRAVIFACVVLPLWISVLVRTFSWMLILERNGPLNRFLVAMGIVDHPLSLLFAFPGVAIGMVHVLLPYAVLPIYAALSRIDPALLRASDGLGASRATTSGACCCRSRRAGSPPRRPSPSCSRLVSS